MTSLLQVLLQFIEFLWPFRLVEQWERGGYYVCGRYWRHVGPGVYPVVPWFCDVRPVSMVPAVLGTGRQDVTLRDGRTVSYVATATVRVVDVDGVLNRIDDYQETTQEILGSVLAERMARIAPERLAPERRGRLLADLTRWSDAEARQFGVEVTRVRFTSFVVNPRVYRVFTEGSAVSSW